jgi:hypothetical protein
VNGEAERRFGEMSKRPLAIQRSSVYGATALSRVAGTMLPSGGTLWNYFCARFCGWFGFVS